MILAELAKLAEYGHGHIEVKSGYNGKVLCKKFNEKKHQTLAKREVLSFWPEIKIDRGRYCYPIVCCFVDGLQEYEEDHKKED